VLKTGTPRHVRRWLYLTSALLVLFLATDWPPMLVHAREQDRGERHRIPADFMSFQGAEWLERRERVLEEQPEAVLDVMELAPGDVVADVGCGSGYYARRMAGRVGPGGLVYCVDIQQEMLDIMQIIADRDRIIGIVPLLSDDDDPKLPAGEIDWILLADVYHEMSEFESMLAGMRGSLAPGGRVALLEYRIEDGTGDNLKSDHAMSVRQVLAEWLSAGFALAGLYEFLPSQHLFIMKAAGDVKVPGAPILNFDVFEAVDRRLVEVEAIGSGGMSVTIRIRNLSDKKMLVTMPVGVYFQSVDNTRDMVSRRDAAVRLFDGEWHDWVVRSVGRQQNRPVAALGNRFTIEHPSSLPALNDLMYVMQVGTYRVDDSPLLYVPRSHGVEQTAVWISEVDPSYDDIVSAIQDERMPAQYVVGFALVYCDLAGIDVTETRIWKDREQVFSGLRDRGLTVWYQSKMAGQAER